MFRGNDRLNTAILATTIRRRTLSPPSRRHYRYAITCSTRRTVRAEPARSASKVLPRPTLIAKISPAFTRADSPRLHSARSKSGTQWQLENEDGGAKGWLSLWRYRIAPSGSGVDQSFCEDHPRSYRTPDATEALRQAEESINSSFRALPTTRSTSRS